MKLYVSTITAKKAISGGYQNLYTTVVVVSENEIIALGMMLSQAYITFPSNDGYYEQTALPVIQVSDEMINLVKG